MTSNSMDFGDYLIFSGLSDDVYSAMMNPDLSVVVMKVLEILQLNNSLPDVITKQRKCEERSTALRNEGNRTYIRNNFQSALICYNMALLFAPAGSRALKLAYSNRSALLYKAKAYEACLNDIDTCFELGCPLDIIEKLRIRKENAQSNVWTEKLAQTTAKTTFSEEYFQLNRRNPQIPCASMDVGIIIDNGVPKVVVTTDIKVGAVLAVETAFVSKTDISNKRFACDYCHKMNLNLKPCKGCCSVLFCNEDCREKGMREYHSVECQIIEVLENLTRSTWLRLALNAVLKMKEMCKSWPELIAASHTMGSSRIKTSSVNEIYDSNHKFSLLNSKDDRHFLHGPMYNISIHCAFVIHYLEKVSGFYPQQPVERNEAKRAVGRLLMFLSLYAKNNLVVPSVTVKQQRRTEFYDIPNFGWFSFVGKLKIACDANVLIVGLNKQIGLVAQQPIMRGMELIVSDL